MGYVFANITPIELTYFFQNCISIVIEVDV